ncbi:hypothetical protein V8C86DRAFT_2679686 [Haematococcus lacustris]
MLPALLLLPPSFLTPTQTRLCSHRLRHRGHSGQVVPAEGLGGLWQRPLHTPALQPQAVLAIAGQVGGGVRAGVIRPGQGAAVQGAGGLLGNGCQEWLLFRCFVRGGLRGGADRQHLSRLHVCLGCGWPRLNHQGQVQAQQGGQAYDQRVVRSAAKGPQAAEQVDGVVQVQWGCTPRLKGPDLN